MAIDKCRWRESSSRSLPMTRRMFVGSLDASARLAVPTSARQLVRRQNVYQVDAWLAGRMIELLFSPFDLDRIEVRLGGKPAGTAVPFVMGRHRHPKTRTPGGQARTEPAPTGIDYLGALGDSHDEALREQVSYQFLIPGPEEPGESGPEQKKEEEEGPDRD